MATLTLTIASNGDDREISDLDDPNSSLYMRVGGVSTTPLAGHGIGFRFTNVTLTGADTINNVIISLYKETTHWTNQADRWTFQDVDSASAFTGTSPNRPGDPAVVTTNIAAETHNINHADNTRYSLPTTTPLRETLAANLSTVLDRGGWASGNAVALVCNSDQDTSAVASSARKSWAAYDHADASSEPQLIIDYTAAASQDTPELRGMPFGLRGHRQMSQLLAQ